MAWEAEMEGRQAVALAPTDPNRHSDLAGIVGRAGRFGEALEITSRGLSLNPQHLPSLHCRAQALVSLGRSDEAQELLTSALLEDPDLAQLHASIGLMLEDRGDLTRSCRPTKGCGASIRHIGGCVPATGGERARSPPIGTATRKAR
jgi:Flp pilus assembly protein TadD